MDKQSGEIFIDLMQISDKCLRFLFIFSLLVQQRMGTVYNRERCKTTFCVCIEAEAANNAA